jgi:hypothetical protein
MRKFCRDSAGSRLTARDQNREATRSADGNKVEFMAARRVPVRGIFASGYTFRLISILYSYLSPTILKSLEVKRTM